jgi:hypothetical protein
MFKGIGDPWVRTTNYNGSSVTANQRLLVLGLLSFELSAESESKESQKFNSFGELVTASQVKGSTSYSFTLSYNEVEWGNLGFALNQFPRTASSVPIPQLKFGSVPAASPYTIADAALVTGNIADVSVSITESGSWGEAGQWLAVVETTPGPGQVRVQAGTLTFNAAQAGAPIAYTVYTTYSSVQDLGGPSGGAAWGQFEFWGKVLIPSISQGVIVHIPQATIAEDPTITIDDSVPTVEVVCGMGTPTGWDKPFRILNMNTATLPG